MLPLAHIYVATQVSRKKTPLLVFGSILPDISWTSSDEIGRDKIHYAPQEFYDYIVTKHPKIIDLGLGVKLHSNIDKGTDYYSDGEHFSGFAFKEGKKIEPKISKSIGEKSIKSFVLSHNFIEASVDIHLLAVNPDIVDLYRKSIDTLDWEAIYVFLSEYLEVSPGKIKEAIKNFLEFVGPESYISQEILVSKMTQFINESKNLPMDHKAVKSTLEMARKQMENKYEKYLDDAINQMKLDFASVI